MSKDQNYDPMMDGSMGWSWSGHNTHTRVEHRKKLESERESGKRKGIGRRERE